jgi:hypothetical protein
MGVLLGGRGGTVRSDGDALQMDENWAAQSVQSSGPYTVGKAIPHYSILFDLLSVPVHSANCVKIDTVACGRVLSSAPL